MKYVFNGIEIDSEKGSPNLNIPPGNKLQLEPGDIVEIGELKYTVPIKGTYMVSPLRISGLSTDSN